MKKIRKFALPAVVAIATLAITNTASAGEPFHPFWDPIVNFFGGFFYF